MSAVEARAREREHRAHTHTVLCLGRESGRRQCVNMFRERQWNAIVRETKRTQVWEWVHSSSFAYSERQVSRSEWVSERARDVENGRKWLRLKLSWITIRDSIQLKSIHTRTTARQHYKFIQGQCHFKFVRDETSQENKSHILRLVLRWHSVFACYCYLFRGIFCFSHLTNFKCIHWNSESERQRLIKFRISHESNATEENFKKDKRNKIGKINFYR